MIPKTIHYCWFGKNNKPKEVISYINGWKNILFDYEFVEWNEDNFDININQYTKEAYENRKWAFVTDYVRLYALYNHGGIYMDTDVEVIKSFDGFLNNKAFSGFESDNRVTTGIMGAEKNNKWIKILLEYYSDKKFINNDGTLNLTTNVETISKISSTLGIISNGEYQVFHDGVAVYPKDYFAPKSHLSKVIRATENTYCIHHFDGSWIDKSAKSRLRPLVLKVLGENNYIKLAQMKKGILKK